MQNKFYEFYQNKFYELGAYYDIIIFNKCIGVFKVIKVTKCGYNLLGDDSKCFLTKHIYLTKKCKEKHDGIHLQGWIPKFIYLRRIK